MFGALKDKLKGAIKKFSKDVEVASDVIEAKEETKEEVKEETVSESINDTIAEEKEEEKEEVKKFEEIIEPVKKSVDTPIEEKQEISEEELSESIEKSAEEPIQEEKQEPVEQKSGFFGKIKSMFSKDDEETKVEQAQQSSSEAETKKEEPKEDIKDEEVIFDEKDLKEEKKVEERDEEIKEEKPKGDINDEVGEFEAVTDETDVPDEENKVQELTEDEIKKQVQDEIREAEKPEEAKLKPEEEEDLDEYITDLHEKPTQGVDIDETLVDDKAEAEKELEEEEIKDFPEENKTEVEEITDKAEDIKIEEPEIEEKIEEVIEKPELKEEVEKKVEEVKEEKVEEIKEIKEPVEEETTVVEATDEAEEKPASESEKDLEQPEDVPKKGFFSKITDIVTKTKLSEKKFDELFWEMELVLLENNVAVEVIDKIRQDLKDELVGQAIKRGQLETVIFKTLSQSIESLFDIEKIDLIKRVEEKNKKGDPFVIAFIGVNGSGKTTTIAKVARLFQNYKLKPVIAAADTFRAAAIQQIEEHANNLDVKLIKHDYGSDPAAVAFDAIKHAKQKGLNVVLVDTAGRLHSNTNLMDEMKKIIRVSKPDMKIFIGEAITGNDCVEQAKQFDEAVGIDGVILCKADVDDKGGAAISASYVTGKPIMYLGMGQGYDDLKEFDKKLVMDSLELD
jgi:fused signal recognition particle receptor